MRILAADDEKLALEMLVYTLKEVVPDAQIFAYSLPGQILEDAKDKQFNVAFLDINMGSMTGIEIAKELKEILPDINIIFVTAYGEYTSDAMAMHASGYIEKPVSPDKIKKEISDLRYPVNDRIVYNEGNVKIVENKHNNDILLRVKCFGNFDVYNMQGELIHFERSKSKELFAYLIHKKGTSCTSKELAALLFGDEYGKKQQLYIQKLISSMVATLKKAGAEDVIIKKYNNISIDTDKVDCDYYKFIKGDIAAVNSYHGEFMNQYEWSEFVIGYLENIYNSNP